MAQAMVVLAVEGEYLQLADGRRRKIAKPKRKKAKHVQPTKTVVSLIPACGRALQDADICKALRAFSQPGGNIQPEENS